MASSKNSGVLILYISMAIRRRIIFIGSDLVLGITKFILYWVLLMVLSILMYKYIEQPFMRMREKLVLK